MHNVRRFLVAIVVPAIIVMIFAVSSVAAGGKAGKVAICHWANHKFVEINVSMNAMPAHLRHGDVLTDEYGDCAVE
jgi:hypothetical protein